MQGLVKVRLLERRIVLERIPGSWVRNNPSSAISVISAPVSEMSVQYNDYLK